MNPLPSRDMWTVPPKYWECARCGKSVPHGLTVVRTVIGGTREHITFAEQRECADCDYLTRDASPHRFGEAIP